MELKEYYRSVKFGLFQFTRLHILPCDNTPPIPLWATQYLYTINLSPLLVIKKGFMIYNYFESLQIVSTAVNLHTDLKVTRSSDEWERSDYEDEQYGIKEPARDEGAPL